MGREGLMNGRFAAPIAEVDHRGLSWHRSARCHPDDHPDCVEAAYDGCSVHVRDSKAPAHGELRLPPDSWRGFLRLLDDTGTSGH
ncbi:DUF397 domain-containing protein [Amycolatopsis balhimycina]|nr:DUF397 domain-containing protein [Amycolatopsis balhimycina]